jgi:hypothetical protein
MWKDTVDDGYALFDSDYEETVMQVTTESEEEVALLR